MANPALKNGYLSIATELVEVLARINIPGEEMRILWVVLRKTWGWKQGNRKKDWDMISLSQFAKYTAIKRTNCVCAIRSLVSKRILLRGEKGYKFNQNYEEWVVSKRILGVSKRIIRGVSKRILTIDTITKDNITRSPLRASRGSKTMKLRNENAFSDEYETVVNSETNELLKEPKRTNQNKRFFGFCAYFKARCKDLKDFEPEIGGLKDKVAFHKAAAKYPTEELYALVDFFLRDKKSDEHTTITACFSNDTITNWKRHARN